jgi:hypothetical protein
LVAGNVPKLLVNTGKVLTAFLVMSSLTESARVSKSAAESNITQPKITNIFAYEGNEKVVLVE